MTDRELLERAAKAVGMNTPRYVIEGRSLGWAINEGISVESGPTSQRLWNPLNDDGDALRLAVRLALTIQCACIDDYGREYVHVDHYPNSGEPATVSVEEAGCDEAATRRAIVRAAAVLGEQHE